jgi:hypothetical protein
MSEKPTEYPELKSLDDLIGLMEEKLRLMKEHRQGLRQLLDKQRKQAPVIVPREVKTPARHHAPPYSEILQHEQEQTHPRIHRAPGLDGI